MDPKIELHVHFEGTIRAPRLLRIARRNGVSLPADTAEDLAALMRFRDFNHFIEMWVATTAVLRTPDDFREIVVDYAREAASYGCVYLEGIFTPARVQGGASLEAVFAGYCDGAQQAEEETGVVVRLTPDIPRGYPIEAAIATAVTAVRFRDRGVVGVGLGGLEVEFPPEPYERAFRLARDGGLGSVPHAGEVAGTASIRRALDVLGATRLRHGIRAVDDTELLHELADRGVVCDVCPISNVRTGAVASLAAHPLPIMRAAGVACSISTDDPAMFDTDLGREYQAASALGISVADAYAAGLQGALCDNATKARLHTLAPTFPDEPNP
ncbi:MAG: adenosine deaminase [Acidimicrobiia bacterium]